MTVAMWVIHLYLFFVLGFFGAGAIDKFSNRNPGAVTYAALTAGAVASLAMLYAQASAM